MSLGLPIALTGIERIFSLLASIVVNEVFTARPLLGTRLIPTLVIESAPGLMRIWIVSGRLQICISFD